MPRIPKFMLIGGITAAVLAALGAGGIYLSDQMAREGRTMLGSKTLYVHGRYSAYAQPWGAEQSPYFSWFSRHGDRTYIDTRSFPARTTFGWRWPPAGPGNNLGVWSYNHVGYGDYDGAQPDEPVPPLRVRDIKVFRQDYAWRISSDYGSANLLTEFYLRSDPEDEESKLLEVGWFLHAPQHTLDFMDEARQLGEFVDPQGRRWRVAIDDTFCMFALADGTDSTKGSLDMLAALNWLVEKKVAGPDAWVTGVAIGAEALRGMGTIDLDSWKVEFR